MKGTIRPVAPIFVLLAVTTGATSASAQTRPVISAPAVSTQAPAPRATPQRSRVTTAPRQIRNRKGPQADWQSHHSGNQFTALAFLVKTGDDDLRGDSSAWMDLKFADGTSQTCILKDYDADSWGNNTVHDYDIPQCKLQHARTLDDLRKADIILVYDGDSRKHAPESEDNWDVNEVKVTAQDFVQHSYQCLIDAAGSPLVRLKAIPHNEELVTDSEASGSFDVSQTPSTC